MAFPLNSRPLNTAPLNGGPLVQPVEAVIAGTLDDDIGAFDASYITPVTAELAGQFDDDVGHFEAFASAYSEVTADLAGTLDDDAGAFEARMSPVGGFQADIAGSFDDDTGVFAGHFATPIDAVLVGVLDDDVGQFAGTVATSARIEGLLDDDQGLFECTVIPVINATLAGTLDDDVAAFTSRFDWAALLDPIVTQPYYACDVTVDGVTRRIPISSWQASLKVGTSYVQAVIPSIQNDDSDWILSGADVSFAVYKGARLSDGASREELIANAPADDPALSGGWLNKTLMLKGYTQLEDAPGTMRELTGVQMMMGDRVRCDIDFFLRPGQQAVALGRTITVGYINYYANDAQQYMDVGETSAAS